MSADPALRSLPYWESLEPVLAERERPAPGAPDPRLERTATGALVPQRRPAVLQPDARDDGRAHPRGDPAAGHRLLDHAVRDDGARCRPGATPTCPATSGPATPTCVKVLKVLQWLRGGTRWVLKTPQHLEQFPALVDTFPDATFVVTHRDPVSVTASMVTMIAYTARLTRDRVDLEAIGRLLVGPARAHAAPLRRRARRPPGGPDDRRALRRVHGRRPRHGGPGLRPGRPAAGRARPRVHGVVHGGPSPRPPRGGRPTTWPSSASTPPSGGGPWPSTPSASG